MKILIINGPNINMLGIREPEIYGTTTYATLVKTVKEYCLSKKIEAVFFQSNHEGDIVDRIQEAYFDKTDAIVINPAAYTHTSIAIADAIKAVGIPTAEVHISDISKREDFRQINYIRPCCVFSVAGHGVNGYIEAVDFVSELKK